MSESDGFDLTAKEREAECERVLNAVLASSSELRLEAINRWKLALENTANSVEALRGMWPELQNVIDPSAQQTIPRALALLTETWSLLDGCTDSFLGDDYVMAKLGIAPDDQELAEQAVTV